MDRTILKALYVILTSLGLALVFNYLFFGKQVGISVFIFSAVLFGSAMLFGHSQKLPVKNAWWLGLLVGFFALMPAIRANEFLTFLNVCATFGLLMLVANQLTGAPAFLMRLRDYIILMILGPMRMLARAFSTLSLMSQIHSNEKHRDTWVRVIKGMILALPLLIVFGILFSQADLAFSQFLKGFIHITISPRTVQYLVLLLFAFITTLGWLSYILFPKFDDDAKAGEKAEVMAQPGRRIEVLVFLGLIAALFLVFIGFQVTYLFGGETNIATTGFTYAEYARRGFWELLAVAMLSLLVLLVSEKYAGVESKRDRYFLIPALVLIGEVGIVIVSAFKRLSLYIDAYGMTMLRFYVAAFIVLLLVLFVLLAIKFIKSKQEQFFAFGTLLSVVGFLLIVNVINPDVYIIKANMERYDRTGKLDLFYLRELSADAMPQKIELYNKLLSGEDKNELEELLRMEKDKLEQWDDNWQAANISRMRALKSLQEAMSNW